MSLDLRGAFEQGFEDLTSTAGLNVLSALVVFNIAYGSVIASLRQQLAVFIRGGEQVRFATPPIDLDVLLLDLPIAVLAVVTIVAVVAGEVIRFWAIQLFADVSGPDLSERFAVLLSVGSGFALVVLGLRELLPLFWVTDGFRTVIVATQGAVVAAASLLLVAVYLRQEIALNDGGPTETVRNAVARFRDAPGRIFLVLVVLWLLGRVVVVPGMLVAITIQPVTDSAVGLLLSGLAVVLWAVATTFSIAVVTDAYLQVSERVTG